MMTSYATQKYTNRGYNHDKKKNVVTTLIKDLTFRMPQHTPSEVTVGYNAIRFKSLRERLESKKHYPKADPKVPVARLTAE